MWPLIDGAKHMSKSTTRDVGGVVVVFLMVADNVDMTAIAIQKRVFSTELNNILQLIILVTRNQNQRDSNNNVNVISMSDVKRN